MKSGRSDNRSNAMSGSAPKLGCHAALLAAGGFARRRRSWRRRSRAATSRLCSRLFAGLLSKPSPSASGQNPNQLVGRTGTQVSGETPQTGGMDNVAVPQNPPTLDSAP